MTWQINVENTVELLKQISSSDTQIIFLSSSTVFDGIKQFYVFTDRTKPKSNYGKQKLATEETLQQSFSNLAILRLTKVVSEETPFMRSWMESAELKQPILAFTNRYLSPIGIDLVCFWTCEIIKQGSTGLFHLGGDVELSYFEYANQYFNHDSATSALITAVEDTDPSRAGFNSLASRLPVP